MHLREVRSQKRHPKMEGQPRPSWYLVATSDKMIPPPAQRSMSKRAGATMVEIDGSHAVYVSKPEAVAQLIEQAAKSLDRSPPR